VSADEASPVAWTALDEDAVVVAADGSEVGRVVEVAGDEEADIFDGLVVKHSRFDVNRYVAAELDYLLRDSDARAIVYDTRFTPTLAEVADGQPLLGARLAVGDAPAVAGSTPRK